LVGVADKLQAADMVEARDLVKRHNGDCKSTQQSVMNIP